MHIPQNALFTTFILQLFFFLASPSILSKDFSQIVVFDAGSSGTRVHVYNFHWDRFNIPRLDKTKIVLQTKRVKPGLSTLSELSDMDIEKSVSDSFTSLLNFAKKYVALNNRLRTPVILKATAGMRLIDIRKASKIMNACQQQLLKSGFLFLEPTKWASIIPGSEEAGLAWIAANYLNGTLDTKNNHNMMKNPTIGIIEMGGASSQVSFEIYDKNIYNTLDEHHRFKFKDFQNNMHYIYAMSYLGFGRDSAYNRLDTTLTSLKYDEDKNDDNKEKKDTTIYNPCHRKNYVKTFPLQNDRSSQIGRIHGSGNYEKCLSIISKILFNASLTNQPQYIPGTILDRDALLPSDKIPFVATEVFYYARDDILKNKDQKYDHMKNNYLMNLLPKYSNNLGKLYCENSDDTRLWESNCFTIGFQTIFLQNIHVVGSSSKPPKALQSMSGVQVEWAIGAAVQHLASQAHHNNYNTITTTTTNSWSFSFSETIFFAIIVTFAILCGLIILAKFVSSTECLYTFGYQIFLYSGRNLNTSTRRRRKDGKNSDIKKPNTKGYDRVDENDNTSIDIELTNQSC
jgi:hypothetical protein